MQEVTNADQVVAVRMLSFGIDMTVKNYFHMNYNEKKENSKSWI